mgnify:CR=1 FL=1
MNLQPAEKRVCCPQGLISLHSIFKTIQGEGPFCGTPCVFVRLAGCSLQCPACDTEYSNGRISVPVDYITHEVARRSPSGLVVITGGEPFRQNIAELITTLIQCGYYVQIETNGTLPVPQIHYNKNIGIRHGVFVVCSPKTGKVHTSVENAACCFKYVMEAADVNPADGLPNRALCHPCKPWVYRPHAQFQGLIYLQPMDSKDHCKNAMNTEAVVTSCLKYGYTLQLQIHKFLNLE